MNAWSRLKRFFAPRLPEKMELAAFYLSERSKHTLAQIPHDQILHIQTMPLGDGRIIHTQQVQRPEQYDQGLGILISDLDREFLRGMFLDFDHRWFIQIVLYIDGQSTPNPNARLYRLNRKLSEGKAHYFRADSPTLPPLAKRLLSIEGVCSILLRENTLSIERELESSWARLDRQVEAQLREYFLLCGQPWMATEQVSYERPLEAAVVCFLEERVAPSIRVDGGDIRLIEVVGGIVRVELIGACKRCPAAQLTLKFGVEKLLMEQFSGQIVGVESVG